MHAFCYRLYVVDQSISDHELTTPYSMRLFTTYVLILGGAPAVTDTLSPSCGICVAVVSWCDHCAAHWSLRDHCASQSTGVCRYRTTCIDPVDLPIMGYAATEIAGSALQVWSWVWPPPPIWELMSIILHISFVNPTSCSTSNLSNVATCIVQKSFEWMTITSGGMTWSLWVQCSPSWQLWAPPVR